MTEVGSHLIACVDGYANLLDKFFKDDLDIVVKGISLFI